MDGIVATLRTAHVWQWILRWRDGELLVSRRLHPIEHLTLQGFPPELAESMSQVDVVKGAGNSCSVPVMGAVLACVLQACPGLMYSQSIGSARGSAWKCCERISPFSKQRPSWRSRHRWLGHKSDHE